jgi:hypothetical protein
MPYPTHVRLEWGGDFVSEPLEIWSNSINLGQSDEADGAPLTGFDDGGSDALTTHYSDKVIAHYANTESGYGSNTRLKWIKLNKIGPDGRRTNQLKTWRRDIAGAGTPGVGTSVGPITTSMVITFLTNAARGRASRGRVFVPHPKFQVASTDGFRYSLASVTSAVSAWSTFLTSLGNAPGVDLEGDLVPVVVTQLETPGLMRDIKRVQVGNFPDYMGSRRNRTREVRTTGSVLDMTGV